MARFILGEVAVFAGYWLFFRLGSRFDIIGLAGSLGGIGLFFFGIFVFFAG